MSKWMDRNHKSDFLQINALGQAIEALEECATLLTETERKALFPHPSFDTRNYELALLEIKKRSRAGIDYGSNKSYWEFRRVGESFRQALLNADRIYLERSGQTPSVA